MIVLKQMARVFARKVEISRHTRDEAAAIAQALLYETPQSSRMIEHS